MAINAQKSRILIGDYSLSATTKSVSPTYTADMLDATVLTDTAKSFVLGQNTHGLTANGVLDTSGTADAELDQFGDWAAGRATEAVTYAPSGTAVGSETWLVGALEGTFTTGATHNGLVTFDLNLVGDGPTDLGYSYFDLAALAANTNGTARDGGAASSGGGVGHLHVTAFSGFTNIVVKIQHSTDNFSGDTTDLITFTTATGITSERAAVTGSISQYVRAQFTKTGTGSATIQVGFARR